MTEDSGQDEFLWQRIKRKTQEEKEKEKEKYKPPSPPISASDQQEIDKLAQKAIEIAKDMVKRMGVKDIDGLRRLISDLRQNGLQHHRRDAINAMLQTSFVPHSWRQNPEASLVQSYFNNLLDRLTEEYGEKAVQQHLIEEFSSYADKSEMIKSEKRPDNSRLPYSNKKLALAFKSGIIVVDPSGMSKEQKAGLLKSFEEQIVEEPFTDR